MSEADDMCGCGCCDCPSCFPEGIPEGKPSWGNVYLDGEEPAGQPAPDPARPLTASERDAIFEGAAFPDLIRRLLLAYDAAAAAAARNAIKAMHYEMAHGRLRGVLDSVGGHV